MLMRGGARLMRRGARGVVVMGLMGGRVGMRRRPRGMRGRHRCVVVVIIPGVLMGGSTWLMGR